ncbi:MAG TPA: hypothetical protein VJ835_10170 [Fimbriimonadaceae bacterium]|jgi:hypothetical protein|nr:hypothetical protein [Fimbriimonadaceae bacterium]
MSTYIKPNVYVRIQELETPNAPRPLPLESGFSEGQAYEVLGLHVPSDSSKAFLILKNDYDEMWFISVRHCRIVDFPIEGLMCSPGERLHAAERIGHLF